MLVLCPASAFVACSLAPFAPCTARLRGHLTERGPLDQSAGTVWIWCSDAYGPAESAWLPASPTAGYSLCCSVYVGRPVNLFTARQGLNLAMGLPRRERWGTLVRPVEVRADGVVWLMDLREPGQTEARQVQLLVGRCDAKLLLTEDMDPDPKLWAEPVWVSRDGAGRGAGWGWRVPYAATGVRAPWAWGKGRWGTGHTVRRHSTGMVWRLGKAWLGARWQVGGWGGGREQGVVQTAVWGRLDCGCLHVVLTGNQLHSTSGHLMRLLFPLSRRGLSILVIHIRTVLVAHACSIGTHSHGTSPACRGTSSTESEKAWRGQGSLSRAGEARVHRIWRGSAACILAQTQCCRTRAWLH